MSENKPNKKNNSNKEIDTIGPEEKVCFNCKHLLWMVGIGMGLRCSQDREDNMYKLIPNRRHTCNLFENKEN